MLARVVVVLAGMVAAGAAQAQGAGAQQWLCVTEQATGYSYSADRKRWEVARFDISSLKYIVKRADPLNASYGAVWIFVRVGDTHASSFCGKDFFADQISCDVNSYAQFNSKTLRFQRIYASGFVSGEGETTPETPIYEIGRCSPL